jgi:16S rRNA (cytosine967-C5)-methyltransferase
MKKQLNLRSLAAQAVEQVLEQGQSLSNVLPPLQQKYPIKTKRCFRNSALACYVPFPS